ncbi:quaternary amine ABC transporter ATP-binding protein [Marinomonas mediterranea]|jgi:glycine betaine/L-proline transport ATP binding subunit|uniref:Quaternary amine transport ATP-binding protein n=1 Tax=Marinomonas mediterranea (strain ATCC 700492 / JCM 21426 / NBRC 103028 / MMB-1) TaxID=717774 RepID=F2JTA2_MARM1|nr:glycine betaine/L-proline ABC transporter ATP-binding protein [Marinomonas mediterranea]ADZ90320.1 glycine betaine/L-proline ABC transporter, ATPase subunit [Marinomonas mediterranea MMB-1]WCN16508.1 betaine/proline/choline family ABC transporter ATP-binding protein [Marinomonas mediterranea MMB-1]
MDNSTSPLIEIESLYQIFGSSPKSVLPKVKQGMSKSDVLAETGHTVGLRDINLSVKRGEIFVIMGLSGSGKSTLIRHFNRLIDPTAGKIKVEGDDILTLSAKDLVEFRRHKMSMVFQHFGLMPHRCVLDNVGYGLSIKGEKRESWSEKAKEWLETVGLEGYEDQYPSQLSGGQQQRVGLARALCTDAEILLMDEAFSALDPLIRYDMQSQLIELQKRLHKTIVFITHDLDEALRLGDRIAVLKDGEMVQVGTPEDIILNPIDDYVRDFAKDVNRAKALKVSHVMNTQGQDVIDCHSADDLKAHLTSAEDSTIIWTKDNELQGVVTPNSFATFESGLSKTPLLHTHSVGEQDYLQDVLPIALSTSNSAIPVLNAESQVAGTLTHLELANALSPKELEA